MDGLQVCHIAIKDAFLIQCLREDIKKIKEGRRIPLLLFFSFFLKVQLSNSCNLKVEELSQICLLNQSSTLDLLLARGCGGGPGLASFCFCLSCAVNSVISVHFYTASGT